MIVFGTPFFNDGWGWGFPFPLLLIGLVVVAIFATRDKRRTGNVPPPPWGSPPPAAPRATAPASGPAPGTTEGTTMSTTDTPTETTTRRPGQLPAAGLPDRLPVGSATAGLDAAAPARRTCRRRGRAAPAWCCSGRPSR